MQRLPAGGQRMEAGMPQTSNDRTLTVGAKVFAISATEVPGLIMAGLVYSCGEDHDLHLDPARRWDLQDIEDLMAAISEVK